MQIDAAATLDTKDLGTVLGWTVAAILGSGLVVLIFRVTLEGTPKNQKDTGVDKTLVRSWLAIALVSGLLLLSAASFFLDDTTLRSLLMGGVVASAGTATAFYFASKTSEQTQKNLLDAAFGTAALKVPDLTGMTVAQARAIAKALQVNFVTDPVDAADAATVSGTTPVAGASLAVGGTLTASTTPAAGA